MLDAFRRAVGTGDLRGLLDLLVGDGGGIVQAMPRPVHGADRVARVLTSTRVAAIARLLKPTTANGGPALVLRGDGAIDTVLSIHVEAGRITRIYAVRNPAKLSHMTRENPLTT